ncbi:MAG TPA: NUDIX hydrolase, partial [Alphaproteobacteria bacterium]|nr:NUDIX hydrolase [Alphaproteobacteria bacterium]
MYKAPYHEDGGVQSIIDGVQKVEIEGDEYHICREAMNSSDVYEFVDKSNKQILDKLFREEGCVFEQGKSASGDFIVCKLVVLDDKKRTIKGTPKQILNTLQDEKACKMTSDAQSGGSKEQGGNLSAVQQYLGYSAGVAIVLHDTILLTHPTNSKWKGSYSIPKGKVEEGESFLAGAIRELAEETGIQLTQAQIEELDKSAPVILNYVKKKNIQTRLAYFVLRIDSVEEVGMDDLVIPKEQLQLEEVDWAGFVEFDEARERMGELQIPILEAVEGKAVMQEGGEAGYLYRYHPIGDLENVKKYGLKPYTQRSMTERAVESGDAEKWGWDESMTNPPEDQYENDYPRIFFTPVEWEGGSEGRVPLRIKKDPLEYELHPDENLPPDVFMQGENVGVEPENIEIRVGQEWKPLNEYNPDIRYEKGGEVEQSETFLKYGKIKKTIKINNDGNVFENGFRQYSANNYEDGYNYIKNKYPEVIDKFFTPKSAKKIKQYKGLITLYRGINSATEGKNYYSPEKSFALEFTQSGKEGELEKIKMNTDLIYRAKE